jgi:hypothetical protein
MRHTPYQFNSGYPKRRIDRDCRACRVFLESAFQTHFPYSQCTNMAFIPCPRGIYIHMATENKYAKFGHARETGPIRCNMRNGGNVSIYCWAPHNNTLTLLESRYKWPLSRIPLFIYCARGSSQPNQLFSSARMRVLPHILAFRQLNEIVPVSAAHC